jgi:hypothetical protein
VEFVKFRQCIFSYDCMSVVYRDAAYVLEVSNNVASVEELCLCSSHSKKISESMVEVGLPWISH